MPGKWDAPYSKVLTRDYEDGAGVPGRFAGVKVGTAIDPDADYAAGFLYDAVGRPSRVTGPGLPAYGAAYNYLADSGLIEQVDFMTDAQTIVGSSVRSYEPQRDLLTQMQNTWTGHTNPISTYAYESDDLGRRDSVVRTGEAFTADHFDLYGYNDRSELTASDRYLGSDPQQTQNPVPTADHAYVYDPIGNREEYTDGTNPTTNYTANNVNQYTATTNPTESFTHDADGNLTADGTLTHVWNAENRLIETYPTTPETGDKKLVLAYDYMGRRVRKLTYEWTGTIWSITPIADRRFIYKNWLLLLELDGLDSNAVIRKYAWGLDLSGTRQGAAGIGGLLATHDESTSKDYAYFYDANGNVGQLIDTSDGSVAAHYEYDPYGGFLATTGIYATINPFRFSTKYLDNEVDYPDPNSDGLYYYGYRYYSPRLGRWMSRDPMGLAGGAHAYGFVGNAPSTHVDPYGLSAQPSEGKVDKTKVCCKYDVTSTTTHRTPYGGTWTSHGGSQVTTRTRRCTPGATEPSKCCGCPGPVVKERGWSYTTYNSTFLSAEWGACCTCTIYYSRGDMSLGFPRPRKWNHAVLSMTCTNGKRMIADHAIDGGPYHWEWSDGTDDEPSHGRGAGFPPDKYPVIIKKTTVPCDVGERLIEWIKKLDDDEQPYDFIHDCHWFARSGIWLCEQGDPPIE